MISPSTFWLGATRSPVPPVEEPMLGHTLHVPQQTMIYGRGARIAKATAGRGKPSEPKYGIDPAPS